MVHGGVVLRVRGGVRVEDDPYTGALWMYTFHQPWGLDSHLQNTLQTAAINAATAEVKMVTVEPTHKMDRKKSSPKEVRKRALSQQEESNTATNKQSEEQQYRRSRRNN
eukprot:912835-Prorocentrum_minimum.AAC.1